METNQLLILAIIGLVAGVFGGALGLGGGLIVIPSLVYFMGMSQHNAQGTNLAFMLAPIGILAVVNYYNKGFVNVKYAAILAVMFFIGAYIGARYAMNIPDKTLKIIFGVVLILVGVKMITGK
ncbi:MAG: permease [Bacteroidetes bacterium HGW-Bacteroidetes-21]|jgi:hypothetical protein|nr:MAG: permease [Bacteroidetes bacterium HGW-Bacteroidetes-21]